MALNLTNLEHITQQTLNQGAQLVVVTKTQALADLEELYRLGYRHFGENKAQEIVNKSSLLPLDIHWHFIGHLQTNKVRAIIDKVHLIHSVDSLKLLLEIEKEAVRIDRQVSILIQMHIAAEETKYGLSEHEAQQLLAYIHDHPLTYTTIAGIMGMATNTADHGQIRTEFQSLMQIVSRLESDYTIELPIRSFGMSADYEIAMQSGSNMIRVGSLLFS